MDGDKGKWPQGDDSNHVKKGQKNGTIDRTWYDIVKLGLPLAYPSQDDVSEEIRAEVVRWVNSSEYNTDPVAFLIQYQKDKGDTKTAIIRDLLEPTYVIVKQYTQVYFRIESIDHVHRDN